MGIASTQQLIPVRAVDGGVLRLADGSVRAILECPSLAFGLRDEADQRALFAAWSSLLNSLDHPVQVLISTRDAELGTPGMKSDVDGTAGRALRQIRDSQQEMLRALSVERTVVDRRFLVVVPAGDQVPRGRLGLTRKTAKDTGVAEILTQRLKWIEDGLARLGIRAARLSTAEVVSLLRRALCRESMSGLPTVDEDVITEVGDAVAPAAFIESPTEVRLGDRLARTHAVTGYPRALTPGWVERLLGFDGDLDVSLHVLPAVSATALRFLSRRAGELSSTARLAQERGQLTDPLRVAALEDVTELQDRLARGDERLYTVGLYVTVHGQDRDQLDLSSRRLEALLGSLVVDSRRLTLQQAPALISSLPLGLDRVGLRRFLNTSALAATFPFTGSDLTSTDGLLYGVSPKSKSVVFLDPFALHNHNEVIFATSGAGKSYLTKLKLIRAHQRGIRFHVIDPEGEYAPVVTALGGTVITVCPGRPVGIDPFQVDAERPGALASRIASLLTLIDLLGGGLSVNQRAAAEEALSFAYASHGYSEGRASSDRPPDLAAVIAALTRRLDRWQAVTRAEVEELAHRLDRYVSGSGRWLFEAATEMERPEGPVAYVLSDMPEEDRAPAMFLVLDRLQAVIAENRSPLLMPIDEAWRLMRFAQTAGFVQELAKTLRKRHAGLVLITQDISDVLSTPVGEAVVTSAASQVLMRQAPQAMPRLAQLFNLTPAEQSWLLTAQPGEGLLLAGDRRVPFRSVASQVEDAIIRGTFTAEVAA